MDMMTFPAQRAGLVRALGRSCHCSRSRHIRLSAGLRFTLGWKRLHSTSKSTSHSSGASPVASVDPLSSRPADLDLPKSFAANQVLSIPDDTRQTLEAIVRSFQAPIRYAFAYGSGVFAQEGYRTGSGEKVATAVHREARPQLDLILATTHSSHFHAINMAQNPSHYSTLARALGSSLVGRMNHRWAAHIWFNPFTRFPGIETPVKYGVMEIDDMCADLLDWNNLYISGRMQKPIKILRDDTRVRLANQVNLVSALRASLLLLPDSFSERELYRTVAGLSYMGDPRMNTLVPGENPQKVDNIIAKQMANFRRLYDPLLEQIQGIRHSTKDEDRIEGKSLAQDKSELTSADHLRKLPRAFLKRLDRHFPQLKKQEDTREEDAVLCQVKEATEAVQSPRFREAFETTIATTVRGPAWGQAIKGIISAGPWRSLRYSAAKLGKARKT